MKNENLIDEDVQEPMLAIAEANSREIDELREKIRRYDNDQTDYNYKVSNPLSIPLLPFEKDHYFSTLQFLSMLTNLGASILLGTDKLS